MNSEEHTVAHYFVMVDGQRLGPFDKRTITGMRVKRILTNDHILFDDQGGQITVLDLLGGPSVSTFGNSSMMPFGTVFPRFEVQFVGLRKHAYAGLHFIGTGEVRVQPGVLRVAGTLRKSWWTKPVDARIKIALKNVQSTTVRQDVVEVKVEDPEHQQAILEFKTQTRSDAEDLADLIYQGMGKTEPGEAGSVTTEDSAQSGGKLDIDFLAITDPDEIRRIVKGSSSYTVWAAVLIVALVLLMALSMLLILGMRKIAYIG